MVESDWNMSDATMYAIRTLFDEMNNAHYQGKISDWHKYINILYKEMYPFMSQAEDDKAVSFIREAKAHLSGDVGIEKHQDAEVYLRYLAGKYNMLLRTVKDGREAMGIKQ